MRSFKERRGSISRNTIFFLMAAALVLAGCTAGIRSDAGKGYHRIVVLSDLHIPGNDLPAKEKALQTVNSWNDVDMIAVTGDIVSKGGAPDEFVAAKNFLGKLSKPLRVVGGNHDYIYPDSYPPNPATGHTLKEASPEKRQQKLELFKKTWGLKEISYSERLGNYLLVFLTPDHPTSNNYSEMTDRTLGWFEKELERNKKVPTIVFFHAPLQGTYKSERIAKATTPDSYNAEPAGKIREILLKNRQVFMWVSGHLHVAPPSKSFASPVNLYEKQVWVIHNADWNGASIFSEDTMKSTRHDTIWTNSLFLYPEQVVVRTYDHKQGIWLKELERSIKAP
jgi:Icc-related predicted phosphoesterase